MPRTIATVLSRKYAKLHEMQTIYGAEDLHDLLELIIVDSHNERVLNEQQKKRN